MQCLIHKLFKAIGIETVQAEVANHGLLRY